MADRKVFYGKLGMTDKIRRETDDTDMALCRAHSIIKIFTAIICLVSIVIGTCFVLSYVVYSPQKIVQHKVLSRITDADFPKLRMIDWVLSENGPGNCYYWIHASFEELPNRDFYTSIEDLICKGNEHWSIEDDKYIFQKEKIMVEIKKYKPDIYIDMSESLFIWE